MKKLRCESQADIFGKRDSHQWLVYMMVKWRLPCLENVINTLVWYNNTHISFAINYIALFLQSHPMWVARVPAQQKAALQCNRQVAPHVGGASARLYPPGQLPVLTRRTPCGWRECPCKCMYRGARQFHCRTPCGWRECPSSTPFLSP